MNFFSYCVITAFYLFFSFPVQAQKEPIRIVYPRQGQLLSTTDSVIVLGQIHVDRAKLYINDQYIATAKDGAFAGYVGIDRSRIDSDSVFIFQCKVLKQDSVYMFSRKVKIPISPISLDSAKAAIDLNYLFPQDSIWLRAGDRIQLKCRATPGSKVGFSVINSDGAVIEKDRTMSESEPDLTDNFGESVFGMGKKTKRDPVPGIYSASYVINSNLKNASIRFVVEKNNDTARVNAQAVLSTWNDGDIRVAELVSEVNNATVDPGRAYYYFLPKGIRCAINGKMGNQIRLRLSNEHTAWLPEKNVVYLPFGTPVPRSFIPLVRIKKTRNESSIKLVMSEKIPFRVEQTAERQLQLSLFGGISDTDWIRFENTKDDIINAMWSQPEPDVYRLTVDLKEPHYWGYETVYDGTNLIWTIRHKPKNKGLKGLKICVDPGHSKDIGATGPRGVTERQVNVEVATALKKELKSDGATVIMTHTDTTQNLTLYDRVVIANNNHCDLFVSVHHNAPPDGVNPFSQPLGPAVIYYHPQSKKLAEFIQQALVKKTKLPDFGVFQGNIAVCRNAQMPAVLVECAFLSLPDQEKMIVDPKFQKKVAAAIKEGIKKFLK